MASALVLDERNEMFNKSDKPKKLDHEVKIVQRFNDKTVICEVNYIAEDGGREKLTKFKVPGYVQDMIASVSEPN